MPFFSLPLVGRAVRRHAIRHYRRLGHRSLLSILADNLRLARFFSRRIVVNRKNRHARRHPGVKALPGWPLPRKHPFASGRPDFLGKSAKLLHQAVAPTRRPQLTITSSSFWIFNRLADDTSTSIFACKRSGPGIAPRSRLPYLQRFHAAARRGSRSQFRYSHPSFSSSGSPPTPQWEATGHSRRLHAYFLRDAVASTAPLQPTD